MFDWLMASGVKQSIIFSIAYIFKTTKNGLNYRGTSGAIKARRCKTRAATFDACSSPATRACPSIVRVYRRCIVIEQVEASFFHPVNIGECAGSRDDIA